MPAPHRQRNTRRRNSAQQGRRRLCIVLAMACLLCPAIASAQFPRRTFLDDPSSHAHGMMSAGADTVGAGTSVAPAGDVNGDGFADVLVAADGLTSGRPGRVFLVLGRARAPLRYELSAELSIVVEFFSGLAGGDQFGSFVAPAGDVDGDGLDDFLLGAPQGVAGRPAAGAVLVFGSQSFPDRVNVAQSLGQVGVLLQGIGGDATGLTGAALGDVNGDGVDDFGLGLPEVGEPVDVDTRRGRMVVVYGVTGDRLRGVGPALNISLLADTAATQIDGPQAGALFGTSLAGLGDIDGDGRSDFGAGAPGSGSVFVFFGSETPLAQYNPAAPDGDLVVKLTASAWPGSALGTALSGGADVDGDGTGDALLGLPLAAPDVLAAGAAMFVRGGASLRGQALVDLPRGSDAVFFGLEGDLAGSAVALVPDLNGDQRAELLVGAPQQADASGAAYLIYGNEEYPSSLLLERLSPPIGAVFDAGRRGSLLGISVAGTPDTDGDLRGELLIGAPRVPTRRSVGVVYRARPGAAVPDGAPRDLRARQIPGRRVHLSWNPGARHEHVRIFRDGAPITGTLPGALIEWIDVDVDVGERVYFVEADSDPTLRSQEARVRVRYLPVHNLGCAQVGSDVVATWSLADRYGALEVRLDGQLVATLPGSATTVTIDSVPVGDHLIEVRDPTLGADAPSALCRVSVRGSTLPPIDDLLCTPGDDRSVVLTWTPLDDYSLFVVTRNGTPIAFTQAGTFRDLDAPPGTSIYGVTGVRENVGRGPTASCAVDVTGLGGPTISGYVRFADRFGTPLRRGRVRALRGGVQLATAQVNAAGRFELNLIDEDSVELRYEAALEGAPLGLGGPLGTALAVDGGTAAAGDEVTIVVPVPVLLVSPRTRESDTPEESRWRQLTDASRADGFAPEEYPALFFELQVTPGVGRGVFQIKRHVRALGHYVEESFGSRPTDLDLVAFGAAGLAARLFVGETEYRGIRHLILLGTPGLGTQRGSVEARGELDARPPRGFDPVDEPSTDGTGFFAAAAEQTAEFLRAFNRQVPVARGAEVHLIAGAGGRSLLSAVLGCAAHDDRVCVESAHGGIAGANLHTVDENHDGLGRGSESIAIVLDEVLSTEPRIGGGPRAPPIQEAGGGGGVEASYALGTFYAGFMESGTDAELFLNSDTSGSIIVIFSTQQPGGVQFNLQAPSGGVITPTTVEEGTEYQIYSDGEGHQVQAYSIANGEVGVYTAQLSNSADNLGVPYTLELYAQSEIDLAALLTPSEISFGEESTLRVEFTQQGVPIENATVEARIWRPDGLLEVAELAFDGSAYAALVDSAGQAGFHLIEIEAQDAAETVLRERTLQLEVRADVATIGEAFISGVAAEAGGGGGGGGGGGVEEDGGQGGGEGSQLASLWVEFELLTTAPGNYVVSGALEDQNGTPVAYAQLLIELDDAQLETFRLEFPGQEIYAAQLSGPYELARIEVFDASADYVTSDRHDDAHTTAPYAWEQFGPSEDQPFVRGDANADGGLDISDPVKILFYLFVGTSPITCLEAADVDADNTVVVTDAVYVLNFLFAGGASPPAPYAECGTGDGFLGCASYDSCDQ